ncbi:DUF6064 family protein [Xanthobacteraceae bacterium Astr-EGSB]|uniref:DUF6064 family protein n=1 Tax=Astrobacterium formosum TaxID=3069710 RepID=UPI0027B1D8D1|nr:DUF6064 family protein [Xanthobacteraceae bacterium Astr-EGSB]
MPEWWTYSLADFLMFSPRTYYRLTELYNNDIWPAQPVAMALGVAVVIRWLRDGLVPGGAIAVVLAALWLWVGWAYFHVRYDVINWTGSYIAIGFAVEAALILWSGLMRGRLAPAGHPSAAGRAGAAMALAAIVLYPALAPLLGRPWAQAEVFGVMPDPTVVATLGLLAAARRPPWVLFVIPLAWCAYGGATLWTMGSPEALVTPMAAVVALALAAWNTRRRLNTDRSPR